MVDSRAKGRTAEVKAKEELRKASGLPWERTPLSGALDAKHMLKGDLYVPAHNLAFCVEVKHYKDDQLTSKVITSTNPTLMQWWDQTVREAGQMNKLPFLMFKFDRSKWFVASTDLPLETGISIALFDCETDMYFNVAGFNNLVKSLKTKDRVAKYFLEGS